MYFAAKNLPSGIDVPFFDPQYAISLYPSHKMGCISSVIADLKTIAVWYIVSIVLSILIFVLQMASRTSSFDLTL